MVGMKPWQIAKKWQLENSEVPFEQLLCVYIKEGLVLSTDGSFLLARRGYWNGEDLYYGAVDPNCWVAQLAAGENPFNRFLEIAPEPLEYVAWQRRGREKWHVWSWDKFEKKIRRTKNG